MVKIWLEDTMTDSVGCFLLTRLSHVGIRSGQSLSSGSPPGARRRNTVDIQGCLKNRQ